MRITPRVCTSVLSFIMEKETIYIYSRPEPHNKRCITLTAPLTNKVTAKRTIAIPQEINILLLLILQTHFIVQQIEERNYR